MVNALRRHIPTPLLHFQRRFRGKLGRIVAGTEIYAQRVALHQEIQEVRAAVAHLQAERLEREDAAHLTLERRVASVANRVLQVEERLSGADRPSTTSGPSGLDINAAIQSHQPELLLNPERYAEFEDRERGSEKVIAERLADTVDKLAFYAPVLDLGCGRGELLRLLHKRGVPARGVDANPAMIKRLRDDGLEVNCGDLFDELDRCEPGSLGAVTAIHVVEHLNPATLDRLLRGSLQALRSGGMILFETPNPASLFSLSQTFYRDPTHVRPYHSAALRLLAENAGFSNVDVLERSPSPPAPAGGLSKEVEALLFGFQDYAITAIKP